MTQEQKLLLIDLSARLPYGVMVSDDCNRISKLTLGHNDLISIFYDNSFICKPYLRPMSSMTLSELNECIKQSGLNEIESPEYYKLPTKEAQEKARLEHSIRVLKTDANSVDWLNANHFDYRGLIEKGLALEAPEGMYNKKEK